MDEELLSVFVDTHRLLDFERSRKRYRLGLGTGCHGPEDSYQLLVEPIEIVQGPDEANWQPRDILFRVLESVVYKSEAVEFVTVSPRYSGGTLEDILSQKTIVAVGRVLPGHTISATHRYLKSDVDYWAIGSIEIAVQD